MMKYKNLQDLISHSTTTRKYFLSLPVSLQLTLHKHNASIHTAADLHLHADLIRSNPRSVCPEEESEKLK